MLPSLLKPLAGRAVPRRPAILVHGAMSNVMTLKPLARALLDRGGFDGVLGYDSWAYFGPVNRGANLATVDLLHLVHPRIRGMVLGLRRSMGRRAGLFFINGNCVVEGAAQDIAALVQLLEWEDVCLVGHGLGGLVVRCAVESHPIEEQVCSVVTLGTAHSLWLRYHEPEGWKPRPRKDLRFLAAVGERDWVAEDPRFGALSDNDRRYKNLVKVVCPGVDDRGIVTDIKHTQLPELVRWLHFGEGTRVKKRVCVVPNGKLPRLRVMWRIPGKAHPVARYAGRWLALDEP